MRLLLAFLIGITLAAPVRAAGIVSDYATRMKLNETRELPPLTITAEAEKEITAEHGIQLLLNTDVRALWDEVNTVTASGTAVATGKIAPELTPEYRNDYKALFLPVLADFDQGEQVTLNGLALRGYNRVFSHRFIGLDVNGDLEADAKDINSYQILDFASTDHTPPYPPTQLTYDLNADHTIITLSWQHPPDPDLIGVDLERTVTRGGKTMPTEFLLSQTTARSVTDPRIQIGDQIKYTLFARDVRNQSPRVSVIVNIEPVQAALEADVSGDLSDEASAKSEASAETGMPAATVTAAPAPAATATEIADLKRLYSYYKVRYNIKCQPAGRDVPAGDSACLWAKIDLLFTQERTDRHDLSVALSNRDLFLMERRMVWSRKRHQQQCVDTVAPAKYCSALGKALTRADYFLNP